MKRSLRIALTTAALVAGTIAVAVPASGATPAPKGTLTAAEYSRLTIEQAAFKQLRHRKRLTWNQIFAVCQKVGGATALLQRVRTNCNNGVGIDQALSGYFTDLQRCSALATGTTTTGTTTTGTTTTGTTTTGTTTTGTTTTGTRTTGTTTLTPSDLKLFACMQSEYAVISRAIRSAYAGQVALRRAVLDRRFVGRCLLTLAPTTQQLHALNLFVARARQLAADVNLVTKVANGQAPATSVNGTRLEHDALTFDAAGKAFERLHRPQNLSVCPHV